MIERLKTLDGTLTQVWQSLARGVADRRAPAHHPVLATRSVEGGGAARIVILRSADPETWRLTMYTDSRSGKVAELVREPRATILVWDPKAKFQIRLLSRISMAPGTAADWDRLSPAQKSVYGGAPDPGLPIADPADAPGGGDPGRFTVLSATVETIETLHLASDRHRRARFMQSGATWVAP